MMHETDLTLPELDVNLSMKRCKVRVREGMRVKEGFVSSHSSIKVSSCIPAENHFCMPLKAKAEMWGK